MVQSLQLPFKQKLSKTTSHSLNTQILVNSNILQYTNLSAELTTQHDPEIRRVQVQNVASLVVVTQQKLFVYCLQQVNGMFQCDVSSAAEALHVVAWQQS